MHTGIAESIHDLIGDLYEIAREDTVRSVKKADHGRILQPAVQVQRENIIYDATFYMDGFFPRARGSFLMEVITSISRKRMLCLFCQLPSSARNDKSLAIASNMLYSTPVSRAAKPVGLRGLSFSGPHDSCFRTAWGPMACATPEPGEKSERPGSFYIQHVPHNRSNSSLSLS